MNSSRPAVSVVVPFFDSERHIAASIESLLDQTAPRDLYELIFIDNGSSDRSPSVVARYPGLVVLEEGAPGAYAARNAGIARARAPLIAFTDADCAVARDWIASIQAGLADPSVAILLGQCRYPREASVALRALARYENAKTEYVVNRCSSSYHFAYANNMAVRASVFEEIGAFETWKRAADSELVHRLAARRPDLALRYRPEMIVTHREFLKATERARRLSLYTSTNAKIETFRELGLTERLGVLLHVLRGLAG